MAVYWITGAYGFIGSQFIKLLISNNQTVIPIVVENPNLYAVEKIGSKITYDILNDSSSTGIKVGYPLPDYIINFGYKGIGNPNDALLNSKNIVEATFFANFILSLGKQCTFFSIGTINEYTGIEFPNEKSEIKFKLLDNYARTKITIHEQLKEIYFNSKVNYVHLRIANIFGANQRQGTLIPILIDPKIASFSVKRSNYWRDMLYVSDFNDYLYNLCLLPGLSGVINIGSGQSIYMTDFYRDLWITCGKEANLLKFQDEQEEKSQENRTHMDITKLRFIIGPSYKIIPQILAFKKMLSVDI